MSKKKRASRKAKSLRARGRSRFLWGMTGTVAGLGILVYFLVISPGRSKVDLPGTPSYNVLLITLDTTRADHLGCYGYKPAKTPNLDRLAREGIRFARVYCPAPLTLPSHSSIMTGLYPVTHGVRNNGHDLPSGIRTLAEILKGRGYSTAAFVSSFSVDSRFGLGRGFDVYDDTFRSESPFKTQNAERRAEETFAGFSRWLENNGKNRFFGWVHYYDPHLPYDPPSPYKEEFDGDPYDGEIAYMDQYVGAVLERLKGKGILERTIIVIAGDHGEGLGDKVETGHGIFLYEETLRVPLILYNPAVFPRSQVIESQVRLIQQAQAYEFEDNYAEAEQVYLRVLEEVPDSPAGYVNLAIAQARQRKFDQAIRTLNKGIARIPDSEILLVRLGHTHLVTGRSREAFEIMNKVLSLNPRNVDALTGCAGILDSEGRKEEARIYYDRALAVEPESRYLRMSYAGNLASGDRLREAIEVYKKLIDDFPEEQAFYQYAGIAYSYLGEYDRAISCLERALAIRPTPIGYFNLAVAYEKSGNIREAVKVFKLYLDNSRGESETSIRKAKAELERLEKGS